MEMWMSRRVRVRKQDTHNVTQPSLNLQRQVRFTAMMSGGCLLVQSIPVKAREQCQLQGK